MPPAQSPLLDKKQSPSVYISKVFDKGWIIEKIICHLKESLTSLGFNVSEGDPTGYSGEQIVIHTRSFYYKKVVGAKNIVFIFHVDDKIKELETVGVLRSADALIAMSGLDKAYLEALIVDNNMTYKPIFGEPLPALTTADELRPLVFTYFSECYRDGRKNEDWLLDLAHALDHEEKKSLIFRFMGEGWESVAKGLKTADISCEHIDLRRDQPGEYEHQIGLLSRSDYLIYLGFDGGAMSVYDGLVSRVGLVVTNQSFHVGLSNPAAQRYLVDCKDEFIAVMKHVVKSQYLDVAALLRERSVEVYATKLAAFAEDLVFGFLGNTSKPGPQVIASSKTVKANYKHISFLRILQFLKRFALK